MNYLDEKVSGVAGGSVFITGGCRTGTSMMANLIHSCRDVEMGFEPPIFWTLFPLIRRLPVYEWKLLFESYLFEDILMQGLDGRHLNFNNGDDSCIFNSKSREEIENRISKSNSRYNTFPVALTRRVAFKLPEMTPYLAKFRQLYSDTNIIFMLRNPMSQIASLLRMKWFADDAVSNGINAFWLYKKSSTDIHLPFWLPDEDVDGWVEMNELQRCCYYYQLMCRAIPDDDHCIVVDYDSFVMNPKEKFRLLTKRVSCENSYITENLLNAVREPMRNRQVDFQEAETKLKPMLLNLYEQLKSRAI